MTGFNGKSDHFSRKKIDDGSDIYPSASPFEIYEVRDPDMVFEQRKERNQKVGKSLIFTRISRFLGLPAPSAGSNVIFLHHSNDALFAEWQVPRI